MCNGRPCGQGEVRQQRRHVKTKETAVQSLSPALDSGSEFNYLGKKYQSPSTRIQVSFWVLDICVALLTIPGIMTE
jgi:hypothetical protein